MSLLSSQKTAEMDSVVLEIDPVFLYQIGDKLKSCLKASEWDTSNPVWYGKLQIIQVPTNRRQVQFVHNNEIFGVAANKEPVGSPMFQKARDSDRYFTTDIVKAISGKNEVFGIGFQNRTDGLRLLEGLGQYCTFKDGITTGKNPIIKVEINDDVDEVPEESEVEVNNSQAYPSEEATYIQCHNNTTTNYVLQKHFEKSSEQHADDREKELDCLDLNSTASSEHAQSSLTPQSSLFSSIISSTTADEPPEPATAIDEYENGSAYFFQPKKGKNQFVCHLCPKTAKFCSLKIKDLLHHWSTQHDLREPFTCSFCHLIFSTREQLLHHSSARHNIVCYVCSMEFLELVNYKRHICFTEKKRQEERAADNTSHNERNVEERLASGDKPKNCKTAVFEQQITIGAANSEEASCRIAKKRKIQSTSQEINPVHIINSQPEQNDSQPSVEETPRKGVPSSLPPSQELPNNIENGTSYLHPVSRELVCHLCSFQTHSKSNMKLLFSHWRQRHDMKYSSTCQICYVIFSTPEQRLSHINDLHMVCSICSSEFGSQKHLLRHIKKHAEHGFRMLPNNRNHYGCNGCSKELQNIKGLMDHFSPTNQKTQCSLSSNTDKSTTTTTVQKHENGVVYFGQVDGKNQYICHLCPAGVGKFFSLTIKELLVHWDTEHNLRQINACRLCHLIFSTPEQRLRHVTALHKVCSICAMEFRSERNHNRHMKNHNSQNTNKRQEIPSGSSVPSVLVSVGLSNNENGTSCVDPVTNELVCPLCGFKTYSKKNMSLLLAHWQSAHDMEAEPNSCRLCFVIFSTPEQRLSHTRAHHLICSICSAEFIGQNNLLHHLKYWHSNRKYGMGGGNEKHYVCNRCPKEFDNLMDLMNHFELTDTSKKLHDPKFIKD